MSGTSASGVGILQRVCAVLAAGTLAIGAVRSEEKPLAALPKQAASPKANPTSVAKVSLGRQLFFDARLSGDNTMSCATCHRPERGWGDGEVTPAGAGGRRLSRNSQGLLNVGFYKHFFWDGRAGSLEEQALGPIQAAEEMNQNLDSLEKELAKVPGYVEQFKKVFGTKPRRDGIAKSLAAFQRTLVAGNSPLDRFLAGDKKALSKQAQKGMELFLGDAGCARCHKGPLLSDEKFYRLGVSFKDRGRELVTGKKEDRYRFRTPTLRNVALTAPYMHDGSLKTLDDVVTFYYREVPARAPDGRPLDIEPLSDQSFSDIGAIVAFLEALTGEVQRVTPPKLP